jgi:hypothetical protein
MARCIRHGEDELLVPTVEFVLAVRHHAGRCDRRRECLFDCHGAECSPQIADVALDQ